MNGAVTYVSISQGSYFSASVKCSVLVQHTVVVYETKGQGRIDLDASVLPENKRSCNEACLLHKCPLGTMKYIEKAKEWCLLSRSVQLQQLRDSHSVAVFLHGLHQIHLFTDKQSKMT